MNQTDGWVTIGFFTDTEDLEKGIKTAQKELEAFDKENKKLEEQKLKLEIEVDENYKQKVKEVTQQYEKEMKEAMKAAESSVNAKTMYSQQYANKNFIDPVENKKTEQMAQINAEYKKQREQIEIINQKIQDNVHHQELLTSNVQRMNRELTRSDKFEDIKNKVNEVGNSINRISKKIVGWGLAMFGIRGAYSLISRAMSIITSQDEQLKNDVDYIRNVVVYALEPVVRQIIEWLKQIIIYARAIGYAFTEKDIFESANKNLKKAANNAKDLKKQLTGFDEMNVLSDTSSGKSSVAIPDWADDDDYQKKGKEIKSFWDGISQFWETGWEEMFLTVGGKWGQFVQGLGETFHGFYLVFKGIIDIIVGVFEWLVAAFNGDLEGMNKAWEKIWNGIVDFVKGIFDILVGIIDISVGIIKGIFITIFDFIVKQIIEPTWNTLKGILDKVISGFQWAIDKVVGMFKWLYTKITDILKGIFSFFGEIGTKVGDAISGAFKAVINIMLQTVERVLNKPITAINALLDVVNGIPGIYLEPVHYFSLPRLAKGGIVNLPGKGVPIGGALTAEVSREGVIPLTDSQQMGLLGEAIGKYININATVPVYVGNRQIAREMRKIEAEDSFAYNRG